MPGYQTTVIGLQEARLVAIKALLQANIADLNTTLQLAPLSMPSGSAASANVIMGDPYTLDESLAFTICVCMGGGRAGSGLDLHSEFKEIGLPNTSTFRKEMHTRIMVYIHPDVFPVGTQTVANVNTQTEYRERLLARICDWIRGDCFEKAAGVDMTLTSQEYSASGDNLTMQLASDITIGLREKGFGGSVMVLSADITVTGVAQ